MLSTLTREEESTCECSTQEKAHQVQSSISKKGLRRLGTIVALYSKVVLCARYAHKLPVSASSSPESFLELKE